MTISTLFWILFAFMCVANIVMTVLFYKHESELDRQDAKINELLELHGMLQLTKAKRHTHYQGDE